MSNDESSIALARLLSNNELLLEAVQQAVRAAVRNHKQAGNPVVTMRDGKVVWIAPEDIELPELAASQDPVA